MKRIEFYSEIYGLADTVPILRTSEVLPKWISLVRNEYKQFPKDRSHLYRCPGIFDLFNYGYIVPAWHDLKIKSDGEHFGYEIPSQNLVDLRGSETLAQAHDKNTVGKYLPRPPWAHPCVLKINTPWHVITPRGIKLLMTALPYPDSFEIEALTGILDPRVSTEVNLQLNYNLPKGEYTIRAGTPLAMLIPITEDDLELVVRDKNEYDNIWSLKRKFVNSMSYVLNRKRIKSLYEQHWKKNK